MIDAHLDAIEAALAPLRVHRGDAPVGGYPYVVVYADAGRRSSERLTASRHRADFYVQTTCVALGEEQLTAMRTRVVDRLSAGRLVVDGRVMGWPEHTSRPMSRDEELPDRVLFYGVDTWSFSSTDA